MVTNSLLGSHIGLFAQTYLSGNLGSLPYIQSPPRKTFSFFCLHIGESFFVQSDDLTSWTVLYYGNVIITEDSTVDVINKKQTERNDWAL